MPSPAFLGEYAALHEQAAFFDRSAQGKIEVAGPDAPSFLSNLSTNDVAGLPLGAGCEAYFCSPTAKVLFHARIYHARNERGASAYWLDVGPNLGAKLVAHLDRYLISEQVELVDHSERFGQLHLAGPHARTVLAKALGDAVPDLVEFQHMERTFEPIATAHIRRNDSLGVPGYDIVVLRERCEGVQRLLTACGAAYADDTVWETARIEAGTPIYGIDIDENRFVMELPNPLRGVNYAKGCYIGQEPIVMARDRAGHVPRTFLALALIQGDAPPRGTKLYRAATEVGVITSIGESPRWGGILALGFIRRGHQEPGTVLTASPEGGTEFRVIGWPPFGTA